MQIVNNIFMAIGGLVLLLFVTFMLTSVAAHAFFLEKRRFLEKMTGGGEPRSKDLVH